MAREEYQVPTVGTSGGAAAASSGAVRGNTRDDHARSVMTYICGDCGGNVTLSKDSLVACPHCAARVLYKGRTKRMVQFEAR